MTSCCLDCIDGSAAWKDLRPEGRVIHKFSKEEYGMLSDNESAIRYKMGLLFFFSPPVFLIKAILRLGHLLSGHWAWGQGYSRALKIHRIERYHCPLDGNGKKQKAPGLLSLAARTALYSLTYFADATVKLATLPLAALLAMGSTLIATVNPQLARRYFALVEEAWSIDLGKTSELRIFLNYEAPCMQPKRVWDQYNFYPPPKIRNDPKHIHQDMLLITHSMEDCQEYLLPEEHNYLENLILPKFVEINKELKELHMKENELQFIETQLTKLKTIKNALLDFIKNAHLIAEKEITSTAEKSKNITQLYACLKCLNA